jgi:large subunit ribosomal protein L29
MTTAELRQQNKSSLQTTLNELAKKQFKLRMQLGSGQLATNHQIRQVRRDIARVKTIITELENNGE